MRLELLGGSWSPRSYLGGREHCVNLVPEPDRGNPPVYTHIPRPGLRAYATPGASGPGRGIWQASNGIGYCVVGMNVYQIEPPPAPPTLNLVGTLNSDSGFPCSFIDNGTLAFLVDNSTFGYTWNVADGSGFGVISDPTGTFLGATKVDYMDTFFIWNFPDSNAWGCSNPNTLTFNGTLIAGKTGYPDNLNSLIVNRREVLLFGEVRGSEIWYNAGNPLFPFAILPGAYIEWGCAAPYSVCSADIDVFWLGRGKAGQGLVLKQRGYVTSVISNYAVSYAMQQMSKISDALGYTYTRDGHVYVVFTFPSGDQTWVYDTSIPDPRLAWHQWGYTDVNGNLHRHRVNKASFINGLTLGQDWQNGAVYSMDPDYYSDFVDDGDGRGVLARPIVYLRSFPAVRAGKDQRGSDALLDGHPAVLDAFFADFQCGDGPIGTDGLPPRVTLRVSLDRGRTWSQGLLQSTAELDNEGNIYEASFRILPQWKNLGIGRWPIFELSWSFAGPAALAGAWIEVRKSTA